MPRSSISEKPYNITTCSKNPAQTMQNFCYTALLVSAPLALVVLVLKLFLLPRRRKDCLKEGHEKELLSHVVVTGGSSGIGLAIAKDLVKRKCEVVTILARDINKLSNAKRHLELQAQTLGSSTKIMTFSVDVSNFDAISKCAEKVCDENPSPSLLFNVAGTSSSNSFVDVAPSEFERLMSINYLGSVYTTKAFLPYMIGGFSKEVKRQPSRTIVFTSSAAGQVGVYGYTAYSPTKFALRGFAEALQMEVSRENVSVQIAYPPDTDTPGYKLEQIEKPPETHLISEAAGLFQPDDVAKSMVNAALKRCPQFSVYFGIEGWMLATLTAGMSPVFGILDALYQICFMSLLRFVSLFYLANFQRIIENAGKNKSINNDEKNYGSVKNS
mmetsp:Transcript_15928/g.22691  ORF Transcript_15928/g.22691 Transcript_15928/m.22691 type:complete len:385 (+) Transcript_15928:30-1184(+)